MADAGESGFRRVSERANPRSASGLAEVLANGVLVSAYYKCTNDPILSSREVFALKRARITRGRIAGIEPVRLLEAASFPGTVVTERVQFSTSLFNYLWNRSRLLGPGLRSSTLLEIGSRIGMWLNEFHFAGAPMASPGEFVLQIAENSIAKLDLLAIRRTSFLDRRCIDDMTSLFRRMPESSTYRRISSSSVVLHGDFSFSNILIDRGGVLHVIDFGDSRVGHPWEDLARCYHEGWAILSASSWRRGRASLFTEAILKGYGAPANVQSDPLFMLLRMWNAICAVATVETTIPFVGFRTRLSFKRIARVNADWIASSASLIRHILRT